MELALAGGSVALLGYIANQTFREKNFQQNNNTPLPLEARKYSVFNQPQTQTLVGCSDSYPMYAQPGPTMKTGGVQGMADIANQGYIPYMQNTYGPPTLPGGNQMQQYNQPIQTVERLREHREGFQNNPEVQVGDLVGPGIPSNDPTSDLLLDVKSRPLTDFMHNNMVPFYGAHVKQNMAGTGVSSGNYTDGVDVDSGFDYTTPYQDKLNVFTGIDDTYLHKRETGPMFTPAEQQMGFVNGMPAFRPDLDQFEQSLWLRNDQAPCQREMVGPGLAISEDIPAAGGFHEYTRVLPNNVSDYKANQLEGRVTGGKFFASELPTSLPINGVTKNKPNSFWTQARRPTMTTKVGFVDDQALLRPDYTSTFKPKNSMRDQTSVGFGEIVCNDSVSPQGGTPLLQYQ